LTLDMAMCTDREEFDNLSSSIDDGNFDLVKIIISAAIISENILMMDLVESRKYNKRCELDVEPLCIKVTSPRIYNDIKSLFPHTYMIHMDIKDCPSSIVVNLLEEDLHKRRVSSSQEE
jgi:hypothetical protein